MFPVSRIVALLMAGILCFAFLVPLSLATHHPQLVFFVGIVFVAYLIVNVALWQRALRKR
ncbi:MAG: hypothetical protein WCC84_09395 [Candidatus Cybelea sp.]